MLQYYLTEGKPFTLEELANREKLAFPTSIDFKTSGFLDIERLENFLRFLESGISIYTAPKKIKDLKKLREGFEQSVKKTRKFLKRSKGKKLEGLQKTYSEEKIRRSLLNQIIDYLTSTRLEIRKIKDIPEYKIFDNILFRLDQNQLVRATDRMVIAAALYMTLFTEYGTAIISFEPKHLTSFIRTFFNILYNPEIKPKSDRIIERVNQGGLRLYIFNEEEGLYYQTFDSTEFIPKDIKVNFREISYIRGNLASILS